MPGRRRPGIAGLGPAGPASCHRIDMQRPRATFSDRPFPAGCLRDRDDLRRAVCADAADRISRRFGFDLVSLGQDLFSGKAPQLRAAGPWWAIAGLGLHRGRRGRRRAQPLSATLAPISVAALGGRGRDRARCSPISAIRRPRRRGWRRRPAGGQPGGNGAGGAHGDAGRLYHRPALSNLAGACAGAGSKEYRPGSNLRPAGDADDR